MVSLLIALTLAPQQDTALGLVERDLTGDSRPETLRVLGVGPTIDNLETTFTIESEGRILYRFQLAPLTRTMGLDAGRRVISAEQHRARLQEFQQWFFADEEFQRPAEFVAGLRRMAPLRVREIPDVIARDRQASDTMLMTAPGVVATVLAALLAASAPDHPQFAQPGVQSAAELIAELRQFPAALPSVAPSTGVPRSDGTEAARYLRSTVAARSVGASRAESGACRSGRPD